MPELTSRFGQQTVSPQERQRLIRDVFREVAPRYDLMNDLMSFGIHRAWKKTLAKNIPSDAGSTLLDLAGGTGDVANLLAVDHRCQVIVCDPSLQMMQIGRPRCARNILWLAGTAEAIPLANGCTDTVVIAFGIRNVTQIESALAEILRVLKPGGRFYCLEFSRPAAPIRPLYQWYSKMIIPRLGAWVSGNRAAYQYLIESIRDFPEQDELASIIEQAGFANTRYQNLSFGIACLHTASRPMNCESV
jgi:demethylmenaquinone methyltransferase/2-methoxy-6-polyprenyl-1,4-benzoquinol methylase